MTLPPLSEVQRRAVEHELADALVTAGAGSGKTRVLSERYVHTVLEHDVPMRRLAALTFTEKAAGQMRSRIAGLFRARGRASDLGDVEFAPISTIHAFCAALLRQHAVEARLDPGFQVLDAVEAKLLRDDAADLAERAIQEKRPTLMRVFDLIGHAPREVLQQSLDELRSAGVRPEQVVWHRGTAANPAATGDVLAAAEAFANVGGFLEPERQGLHAATVARLGALVAGLEAGADVDPFRAVALSAAVEALKGPRKRAYTNPRKGLETALERLCEALLDAWGDAVFLPDLREVLVAYEETYARLKHERSALDFNDLEWFARNLLQRAADSGHPLDLAPRALLVDEYQDTNPLQAEILELLRANATQFSVGDPKQSIYGFRGADVSVILRERERLGPRGCHAMNASYRACPELVAGINALNAGLFANDAAGVVYEPLEAAATFLPATEAPLEYVMVDTGKGTHARDSRALEAAWIARRIEELVGTPRLDPDAEGPVRYRDIAILFRAAPHYKLATYEAALAARGIPYLTQKSAGFFKAEEIEDLVHILRAVHNPLDTFALACTATGPAMAAADEELFAWFSEGEGTPWERMCAHADAGGPHAHAIRTLQALQVEAATGSLADAVDMALGELGLLEYALLCEGGDRRAANLRKAIETARRLDHGGRRGLADLLRHLETLRAQEAPEAEAPIGGESDDVVRITTVHGAKGLEYPVVFIADAGSAGGGSPPAVQFDGETGVGVRFRDPLEGVSSASGGYAAIREQRTADSEQEEQRLLYVAMTRAEEHLVISSWCEGTHKTRGGPKTNHWSRQLFEFLGTPFEPGTYDVHRDGAHIAVRVIDGAEIVVSEPEGPVADAREPSDEALEEATRLLAPAAHPTAPLGDTRFVVSVSELLTFAASPQQFYVDRVINAGARERVSAAWDAPSSDPEAMHEDAPDPEAGRRADVRAAWDEGADTDGGLDRAAVGRAVHAVIEALTAGDDAVPEDVLRAACEEERGDERFVELARVMVGRFVRCGTGTRMRAALAGGDDVRREVALHARIKFPRGQTVAGFEALLVKGSIDLWLPSSDGVWIVDHKTNRAGARFATPESVAAHYAWQLRLYALAAERVLGADVAGARLVLLDPGWGEDAVEVGVDVSGDQLAETRRLCQAFAVAELEGRYPERWQDLL